MIKVATLFLIIILALALFGKLRLPSAKRGLSLRCSGCGRYRIGRGPCDCKTRG